MVRLFVKVGLSIVLGLYLIILSKFILFQYLTIPEIINHFTFRYQGLCWNNHNFIPFDTITYYLFSTGTDFSTRVVNIGGNIIGFSPFGFILPLLSRKFLSMKKVAVATLGLSLTFELIQLVFRFGSFDVDDLILNTVGGIVGYVLIKLFINNFLIKYR